MAGDRSSKEAKKPAVVVKQAATPLQLKGRVSKNQRAGVKQVHAKLVCAQGHPQTPALLVKIKGRRRMVYTCPCNAEQIYGTWRLEDGPTPEAGAWVQRKARINTSTRARVWYEAPSNSQ